jgi:hypothetical protein
MVLIASLIFLGASPENALFGFFQGDSRHEPH